MTTGDDVVALFQQFGAELNLAVREHPLLTPFFTRKFDGYSTQQLRAGYAAYLKMSAGYVQHTVPLLRAAGLALANGDDSDKRWSAALLENAHEEIDPAKDTGHHIWATDDLIAIGAPPAFLNAPYPQIVQNGRYKQFMIDEAHKHPYGILGAKGVLEHLAVNMADDFVTGVTLAGLATKEHGTYFLGQHGILDLEHTKSGNERVKTIKDPKKLDHIIEGSWVTREAYHSFLLALHDLAKDYS